MKFSAFPIDDQAWLVLRVGIAAVLGGLVGWERDRAGKTAGIRTHMLVGAAAALAVGLGDLALTGSNGGDPTRMMHAVFTGIGFIGGGMIFTQKRARGPFGITSAATVLMVAGNWSGVRPRSPIGWSGGCGHDDRHTYRGALRRSSNTCSLLRRCSR